MKKLALFAPTVALAAACSPSAVSLQPGQWETTVRFASIEAPGAPEAELAPMRAMLGAPRVQSQCLTPEQAANPMGRMMSSSEGSNCQFTDNVFAGGVIRVRGTCRGPVGGTMQRSWEGTYTATAMQAQVSMEMHAPPGSPGPQTVRMSGTMSGRRTGDCPAGR